MEIGVDILGVILDGLLGLPNRNIQMSLGLVNRAHQEEGSGILRFLGQDFLGLLSGLLRVPAQKVKVPQIQPGVGLLRVQLHAFYQGCVGLAHLPHSKAGEAHFVMSLGIVGRQF